MTRFLLGIDDTDRPGGRDSTNRLAREIENHLPADWAVWASLGHRLNPDPALCPTSWNTGTCVVVDGPGTAAELLERAVDYVAAHAESCSAPGLCVLEAGEAARRAPLTAFARRCCTEIVTIAEARQAAGEGALLAGLRGPGSRGLIGAVAAVGLTAEGWSGRMLDYGRLRDCARAVQVRDLLARGILPLSLSPDAEMPAPDDWVDTHGWLRPRLMGGRAVLPVDRIGLGQWNTAANKKDRTPRPAAGIAEERREGGGKGTGGGGGKGGRS